MQRWNWNDAERFVRRGSRRRIWKRIVSAMACVVVFCTTYALILPAITMEQPTFCGFEEHTHDESCYTRTDVPACTQTEDLVHTHIDSCYAPTEPTSAPVVHTHDDNCYTKTRGELTCQTAEFEGHTHGDTCYTISPAPTCGLEETPGHTHGPECLQETLTCGDETHDHGPECAATEIICGQQEAPGHTHGPDCYSRDLICQVEQTPGHKHDDNCYAWDKTLSCGLNEGEPVPTEATAPALLCTEPETQPHVHTESCAPTEPTCGQDHAHTFLCSGTWELTCGLQEHSHTLACFSDPEADVETRDVWERLVSAVELTGVWGDDVVAIAKSQLGYHESTRNYAVWEDGSTHGYTRYGDWYGSPYGDWCAMFASFCVHYAGVEGMPLNWGCRTWIADLSQPELDRYRLAEDYTPKPGDLIFFDWEEPDGTSDDLSDHVGIVAELLAATDTEPARVRTIEGNSSNQVKYNEYDQDDTRILGYGVMPENPELTPEDTPLWTYADDTLYVEVSLPADTAVPADAVLVVTPILPGEEDYAARLAQARQTVEGLVTGLSLYDISFYTPDGDYLPVTDTARVTMGFTQSPVDPEAAVQVLHFAGEDALPQVIGQVTVEEKPLRMRLPEAEPLPLARMIQEPQPEETTPEETQPETVTQTRTVVEFTTQGFSTFAVVQVENAYVTTILDNNTVTADNGHPLDGKILAISTRDELVCTKDNSNSRRGLTNKPTMDANNKPQVISLPVKNEDGKVTVSRSMFWKFTKVEGQDNTYYVRPYDPVTEKESGYLQLQAAGNQSVNVVPGDTPQDDYQILVERQADDEIRLKHAARYLSYDREGDYFTDYGNPNENGTIYRGALVLSEYAAPTSNNQFPVTNLDGQTLAIVSVRDISGTPDPRHVVLSTTGPYQDKNDENQYTRLNSADVSNATFTNGINGLVSIEGEALDTWFWTFEADDAANGVYNIKDSNGKYMTIGDKTAYTGGEQAQITVSSFEDGGNVYITLNQNGNYLNRFGGTNNTGYAGWKGNSDTDNPAADVGSRFVLARREQFTAEVIARNELWSAGRWTGNKLIFFVRQTDASGTARYYAMKVNGEATEIFLEPGQTLEDGAIIYADVASRDSFLWDASASPTGVGWNTDNIADGAIDLWPRIGDLILTPNGDGGQGNVNGAQQEGYTNSKKGQMSITSQLESDNNWGWHIQNGAHEKKIGQPLRAEHNAAFHKIANGSPADIDGTIASTIISDLNYTQQSWNSVYIEYEGGKFVPKKSLNDDLNAQAGVAATESTAFYVAVLNIPEEEIVETSESHDTVVAKILTRHEYQDAVQIDGDARVILLTKQGDTYYALDYQGNAKKLDTLEENVVVFPEDETYNTNRILWDAVPTETEGQFIDMTLENEAVEGLYLSPWKDDRQEQLVSIGRLDRAEHYPGFYGLNETGNLIATSDGTSGTVIKYENDKYVLETVDNLDGHSDAAHTFYVALVTDRGVTYNADEKTVEEYKVVPAVKENVRMRLFNYGSAIDYYGQTYNGTTYNDGKDENGNKDKDNLIYRFFHRPDFTGQAIDGTNETDDEYATADAFEGKQRNYSPNLGADGAPHISLTPTSASATKYPDWFSLGYLFGGGGYGGNDFVTTGNSLTLHQTNGKDWQTIENATGTAINANGNTTSSATNYNPVNNPNYAVQSYTIDSSDGKTGLFLFDRTTGNYYYDSANNAAWYNPETRKMELYDYALVPSGSLSCIGGNFLPFNQGHTQGRLVPNDPDWGGKHTYGINDRTYQLNGIHHDNDPVIGRSSMTDLWFGMTLEIDFTMTADGMLVPIDPNGEPLPGRDPQEMIFEFTGDDDVLVYVDGVLCLDIGGIHGAESGDINFATGTITHQGRTQSSLKDRFEAAGKGDEIQDGRLKPWTKHTLQFFYLERGGNISNCRIGYNLADIPIGGMSVTKEVEGVEEDQTYYGTYEFQLTDVTLGTYSTEKGLDLYYIIRKGEETGEKKTFTKDDLVAGNVKFTLHANETAEFFGFPAGTKLKVREIGRNLGEDISRVKMVKATGTGTEEFQDDSQYWVSPEIEIGENNTKDCKVTCTNELETVDVNITKALEMLDGTPVTGMENTEFTLKYTITEPGKETGEEKTLTVTPGTPAKIEKVPFGSWLDIEEVEVNGYKVEWDYKVKKAESDAEDVIDEAGKVPDEEFQEMNGIHLVGDTEIVCRNRMTFVEVKKTVEGNANEDGYKFTYTVEFDGKTSEEVKFTLTDGGTYRIENLRLGSKVTVTEAEGEYLTSYVITDWTKPPAEGEPPAEEPQKTEGNTATCDKVETPQVIHFTNRPVYELPMTGGVGTEPYTMGGLLLLAAAVLLYDQIRRRRGATPSP